MRFFSERPYIISLLLIALVIMWMIIPMPSDENGAAHQAGSKLQKVQVRQLSSEETELELIFTGRTEPNQSAQIASELDGLLLRFNVKRGARVKKGGSIAEVGTGSLASALAGAQAELRRASDEYKAQVKLVQRGLNAKNAKNTAYAALQAARARVKQYKTELKKAVILAPFDGLIADHHAEVGDFMSVGKPLATLINLDPIRVVGDVAERDVSQLKLDGTARIVMLNGKEVEGNITYISPVADKNTRTFRVEVTLPNADGEMIAGMTAQIRVPLHNTDAYKISPALLTLSADGDIQVATVDSKNRVALNDVELVRSETDGIWVTGIPSDTRIITLGQGFVHDGDLVDPIDEKASQNPIDEDNK